MRGESVPNRQGHAQLGTEGASAKRPASLTPCHAENNVSVSEEGQDFFARARREKLLRTCRRRFHFTPPTKGLDGLGDRLADVRGLSVASDIGGARRSRAGGQRLLDGGQDGR